MKQTIPSSKKELPLLSFKTSAQWEKWLDKNYENTDGIWLKIFKKDSGIKSINYAMALDVALCFGWIDGIKKKLDEVSFIQKFTPRRARSTWSYRNTEHIQRLTTSGKMRPPGIAQVDMAKADGRWEKAYAPQQEAIIPEDFMKELNNNTKARAFFDTLNRTNLFIIYYHLHQAKTPETREKRIQRFITKLEQREMLV
ncbi:YdeI/OmpD-associated family protein [Mucilaginibacter sp. 22184]|uniref:YdeI/OmpD-associated family protein n=1 Tax=Mucilaginibacter sp. 22184 TaxID=3453887 RepID=UPI003F863CB7